MTTTKHGIAAAEPSPATAFVRFPDYQPSDDTVTTFTHVNYPGYPAALARHLGNPETTIIISEIAAALFATASREGLRYPDLLIAFDVDPVAREARNGYLIPEQGKPPDFVLEVASESTGREDETVKRNDYEAMGVLEYWRFDHTGGEFHSAPLAGDRLVDGKYRPIEITRISDELYRGHSDALNLDLRWEYGNLRWYDPVAQRYLQTYDEVDDDRIAAERRAAAAHNDRIAAEQRAAAAESELDALKAQLQAREAPTDEDAEF